MIGWWYDSCPKWTADWLLIAGFEFDRQYWNFRFWNFHFSGNIEFKSEMKFNSVGILIWSEMKSNVGVVPIWINLKDCSCLSCFRLICNEGWMSTLVVTVRTQRWDSGRDFTTWVNGLQIGKIGFMFVYRLKSPLYVQLFSRPHECDVRKEVVVSAEIQRCSGCRRVLMSESSNVV